MHMYECVSVYARECTFCKLASASVQTGQPDSAPTVRESRLRKQLLSHDRVAVDFGSSGRAVVVVAVVAIYSYALFASSRRVASFQVRAASRILIRRHLRCVARRLLIN